MTHPGHNNPWRASNDWGYRVKYDTDKQLHETRQRMQATARECARSDAYRSSRKASSNAGWSPSGSYSGGSSGSGSSLVGFVFLVLIVVGILIDTVSIGRILVVALDVLIAVAPLLLLVAAAAWVARRRRPRR